MEKKIRQMTGQDVESILWVLGSNKIQQTRYTDRVNLKNTLVRGKQEKAAHLH